MSTSELILQVLVLQEKWDETEEKPAVIAITLSAFVAIWAASGENCAIPLQRWKDYDDVVVPSKWK